MDFFYELNGLKQRPAVNLWNWPVFAVSLIASMAMCPSWNKDDDDRPACLYTGGAARGRCWVRRPHSCVPTLLSLKPLYTSHILYSAWFCGQHSGKPSWVFPTASFCSTLFITQEAVSAWKQTEKNGGWQTGTGVRICLTAVPVPSLSSYFASIKTNPNPICASAGLPTVRLHFCGVRNPPCHDTSSTAVSDTGRL